MYYNLGLERGITLSSLVHCPGMVEEAADLLQKLGVDSTDMKQLQQVQVTQNQILLINQLSGLQLLFIWITSPPEEGEHQIIKISSFYGGIGRVSSNQRSI